WDDVWGDLHAGDQVAGLHDLAVERGEDLERVDPVEPLQCANPHVEDTRSRGDQVEPTLGRAAALQVWPGNRVSELDGGIVFVDVSRFHDDERADLTLERRKPREVIGRETPPLGPALPSDHEVARDDRTLQGGQARGRQARAPALEPHEGGPCPSFGLRALLWSRPIVP